MNGPEILFELWVVGYAGARKNLHALVGQICPNIGSDRVAIIQSRASESGGLSQCRTPWKKHRLRNFFGSGEYGTYAEDNHFVW